MKKLLKKGRYLNHPRTGWLKYSLDICPLLNQRNLWSILLMVLIAQAQPLRAQMIDTLLWEDFDGGALPNNWQLINIDSLPIAMEPCGYGISQLSNLTDSAWVITDSLGSIGNYVAAGSRVYWDGVPCGAVVDTPQGSDDWLITDTIQLKTNSYLRWSDAILNNLASNAYEVRITAGTVGDLLADSLMPPLLNISRSLLSQVWTKRQLNLTEAGFVNQKIYVAFRNNDFCEGCSGAGPPGNPPVIFIDSIYVFDLPARDVSVDTLYLPSYVALGNTTISGRITNFGADTINSMTLSWSVNDGTIYTDALTGLSIPTFDSAYNFGITYDFVHDTVWNPASSGNYVIKLWVSAVNGQADQNTANDTITQTVRVASSIPKKMVLIETYNGTWNGWCPDGDYKLQKILDNNPDVFGISAHINDSMQANGLIPSEGGDDLILGYSNVGDLFMAGSRSRATVDRYLFGGQSEVTLDIPPSDTSLWKDKVMERLATPVPVEVFIDHTYDTAGTRDLTVNVTAFYTGPDTGNYRINCYIVEDSVSSVGLLYDQKNQMNALPGHPYEGAGDPIVGYVHRHVLRYLLGGPWGRDAGIPPMISDGNFYTYPFSYPGGLPGQWKEKDIKLVAFVQRFNALDTSDRAIINAAVTHLVNAYDLSVITVNIADTAYDDSTYTIAGKLKSFGTEVVGKFDLNWNIDGGAINKQTVSGVSIPKDDTFSYTHSITWLPPAPGTYTLRIWADKINDQEDRNHSNDTLTKVIVAIPGVGIVEQQQRAANYIKVYPSPTSSILNVEFVLQERSEVEVIVMNVIGKRVVVKTSQANQGFNRQIFDMSELNNGLYLIMIRTEKQIWVKRFSVIVNR